MLLYNRLSFLSLLRRSEGSQGEEGGQVQVKGQVRRGLQPQERPEESQAHTDVCGAVSSDAQWGGLLRCVSVLTACVVTPQSGFARPCGEL